MAKFQGKVFWKSPFREELRCIYITQRTEKAEWVKRMTDRQEMEIGLTWCYRKPPASKHQTDIDFSVSQGGMGCFPKLN